jgi:hypothetical protein
VFLKVMQLELSPTWLVSVTPPFGGQPIHEEDPGFLMGTYLVRQTSRVVDVLLSVSAEKVIVLIVMRWL